MQERKLCQECCYFEHGECASCSYKLLPSDRNCPQCDWSVPTEPRTPREKTTFFACDNCGAWLNPETVMVYIDGEHACHVCFRVWGEREESPLCGECDHPITPNTSAIAANVNAAMQALTNGNTAQVALHLVAILELSITSTPVGAQVKTTVHER